METGIRGVRPKVAIFVSTLPLSGRQSDDTQSDDT